MTTMQIETGFHVIDYNVNDDDVIIYFREKASWPTTPEDFPDGPIKDVHIPLEVLRDLVREVF